MSCVRCGSLSTSFLFCDELAILVDTGSLRSIYKDLGAISGKTIGVMNNVSTGLAVEVGAGLLAGRGMEELMASAVDSCVSSYRVIERSTRPDAIIFCEEGGIEAAEEDPHARCSELGRRRRCAAGHLWVQAAETG